MNTYELKTAALVKKYRDQEAQAELEIAAIKDGFEANADPLDPLYAFRWWEGNRQFYKSMAESHEALLLHCAIGDAGDAAKAGV